MVHSGTTASSTPVMGGCGVGASRFPGCHPVTVLLPCADESPEPQGQGHPG